MKKKKMSMLYIGMLFSVLVSLVIISFVINEIKNVTSLAEAQPLGNILYVGGSGPNNYTTIQQAINDASNGDTIFVYSGIYYENIVIDKSIILVGENRETTIIDGNRSGDVVTITANGVIIQGFGIKHSGWFAAGVMYFYVANNVMIQDCNIYNNGYGIWFWYSFNLNNNIISNCNIYNNSLGIYLSYSYNNTISNCNIYNNSLEGILLSYSYNNTISNCNIYNNSVDGISLIYSYNNTISNCNIYNGLFYGIWIYYSYNNIISNCNIYNNSVDGIWVCYSFNNTISNCSIHNNNYDGIYASSSCNNTIYMNNFMNNSNNVHSINSNNTWHSPMRITYTYTYNGIDYTSYLGNYWSDYYGGDIDGNGIGENAYYIDENNYDYYPLMMPYENYIIGAKGRVNNLNKNTWYNSIQDAINDASNGDTIFVYSGIYYENIVINKRISLIGENRNPTIIDGNYAGDVVTITANGVIIQGFEIKHSGKEHAGVKIYCANNVMIQNCSIYDNYYGISLDYSSNDAVSNNDFTNNGIMVWGNTLSHFTHNMYNNTVNGKPLLYYKNERNITLNGIETGEIILVNCSNFEIRNITTSNTDVAIEIAYCSKGVIQNCSIYNNYNGIYTWHSYDNIISSCNIYNNGHGIRLESSYNNTIYNCNVYNSEEEGICIKGNYNKIDGINIRGTPIGALIEGSYNRISNCEISNIESDDYYVGILILSPHNTISNCSLYLNSNGIWLASSNNTIQNCSIYANSYDGIRMDRYPYGKYNYFINNKIINCSIYWNGYDGIRVYYANDTIIQNCNISYNKFGLQLYYSCNNSIVGNNILYNGVGAWVFPFCYANIIHHNNFIGNQQNARSSGNNIWNNGNEGNYWDNYDGIDADGNGIGDTPYYIIDGNDYDAYPLMMPWPWENYLSLKISLPSG